jgi:MFS family permease
MAPPDNGSDAAARAADNDLATGTFRSLSVYNFRTWASGAFISNVGTWMQRTAQDWLVLTELTHERARSVGIVMALQFGPQLLLLPVTGLAADRLSRRKLLFATQALMGLLALGLGLLTLSGLVKLWHVYGFALALGCVSAFDAPARQTFVSELVPEQHISNAVALNSSSFNLARLVGPALAGVLIDKLGTGWVFLLNAGSYVALLGGLVALRSGELIPAHRGRLAGTSLLDGFRYVWRRRDLRVIFTMLFLIGTFGLNFPIYISTMSVSVFHRGSGAFGLLSSMMATGSVLGALLSARRARPRASLLVLGSLIFGVGLGLAALMPSYASFGCLLVLVGVAAQTFNTTANGSVQLATEPALRGRVIAIFMAIALSGTTFGAPVVGFVADHFGPRFGLGVGTLAGLLAALIGWRFLEPREPREPARA